MPASGQAIVDQLLARLPDSPDSYPQKLDVVRQAVLLIGLGETAYRAASFLDDRILGPATRGGWVSVERAMTAAESVSQPRPLHYIFHTGHVGSTLVSRLLDETGVVLPLREPLTLRTLAEIHDTLDRPESLLERARFERLAMAFQRLWSRGYTATHCAIVKATSSAGRLAPVLLNQRQSTRAVYLNVAAEPYLATLLAGQNAPIDLRGHAQERMRRLCTRLRTPPGPVHSLSHGELAAMSWLVETVAQREALAQHTGRVLGVDFDRFLADVPGGLRQMLTHLELPSDPGTVERIAGSPVLTRYSKAPEHPYGPALRASILAEARRAHREELGRGLRWLERLAATESAAAEALGG
jgi:hypothetical protein